MTTRPLVGAVQVHQTDFPPALPPWFGSPASLVAPLLLPVTVMPGPLRGVALPKLLLAGPVTVELRKPESAAPKPLVPAAFLAFTQYQYVVPTAAVVSL